MPRATYAYKQHPDEERIRYVKRIVDEKTSFGYSDYSGSYNSFPSSGILIAEDKETHHRVIISREEAERIFKEN